MPALTDLLRAFVAAFVIAAIASLVVFPDPTGTLPLIVALLGTPLLTGLFLATGFESPQSFALVFCGLLFVLGLGAGAALGVLGALDVYTLPAGGPYNPAAAVLVVIVGVLSYEVVVRREYTPLDG